MVDQKYLQNGLWGLANSHVAGTMAGHLGAAVITGYFLGENQPELPDAVFRGVTGELERIMAGEEDIWFDREKAGVTPAELFRPLPNESADSKSIRSIAQALAISLDTLHESGHNVIFASIALRALHDHPIYTTPSIVRGIEELIRAFAGTHAGRGYYGKEKGWLMGHQVELKDDAQFAEYASIQQMVDTTIAELIATAPIKKQGFGGLWHVINHAAAITELDRFGYRELAHRALAGHHLHVRLWRTLPDVAEELGEVPKSEHDPRDPVYWEGSLKRDQARLTHRIKTLYGFDTLRRLISDQDIIAKAEDALLYLMA
jgi:hypothetical protein